MIKGAVAPAAPFLLQEFEALLNFTRPVDCPTFHARLSALKALRFHGLPAKAIDLNRKLRVVQFPRPTLRLLKMASTASGEQDVQSHFISHTALSLLFHDLLDHSIRTAVSERLRQ